MTPQGISDLATVVSSWSWAVALVSATISLSAFAYAASRRTQEWKAVWEGHEIRLVVRSTAHQLIVDGKKVAQKSIVAGSGSTLTWTIHQNGSPVVLTATVLIEGQATPVGRICAGEQWVGGTETDRVPPSASGAADPKDMRWGASKVLLADLRRAGDVRLTEAAQRIEVGLRDVLGGMDHVDTARGAYAVLNGDQSTLDDAHRRLDHEANELIDALRELHRLALAGTVAPSLERVDTLLRRVAADVEVSNATNQARRRAAQANREG